MNSPVFSTVYSGSVDLASGFVPYHLLLFFLLNTLPDRFGACYDLFSSANPVVIGVIFKMRGIWSA